MVYLHKSMTVTRKHRKAKVYEIISEGGELPCGVRLNKK